MPIHLPPAAAHRCLVLAHGAGSSADFLTRAFPASACGADVWPLEDRTGSVPDVVRRLAATATALAGDYPEVYLGGVSIGAHAAALAAAAGYGDGCVVAMPAWTGAPPSAGPNAAAAEEVASLGAEAVLRRLLADPTHAGDWVSAELDRAWRDRATLADELRTAARGSAPTREQLVTIAMPALVIALDEDPFHPLAVAHQWQAAIPGADLAVIGRHAPLDDRAVFGRAVGRWLGGLDLRGPQRTSVMR